MTGAVYSLLKCSNSPCVSKPLELANESDSMESSLYLTVKMSYLPAEVKSNLSELSTHLDSIEQQLEVLLAHESLAALNAELPAADALKVNTAVAYTLHALYYTLLRTQGQDPTDHPVKNEIERVRTYVNKVTKALTNEPQQPSVRIDTEAAGRMVNAQLKGSTPLPKAGHLHWKEDLGKILGRNKQ